jgi:ABC-2 type transport system ATP-binding protein
VDPQSRNHIFDSIAALKKQGRTILYTTHYMEEATRLCDRVAIMDRGKLLTVGAVDALIAAHGGPAIVDAEIGGESILTRTPTPLEEIARLAADAAARGATISRLRLERPDLERVFLELTGRSLRD